VHFHLHALRCQAGTQSSLSVLLADHQRSTIGSVRCWERCRGGSGIELAHQLVIRSIKAPGPVRLDVGRQAVENAEVIEDLLGAPADASAKPAVWIGWCLVNDAAGNVATGKVKCKRQTDWPRSDDQDPGLRCISHDAICSFHCHDAEILSDSISASSLSVLLSSPLFSVGSIRLGLA